MTRALAARAKRGLAKFDARNPIRPITMSVDPSLPIRTVVQHQQPAGALPLQPANCLRMLLGAPGPFIERRRLLHALLLAGVPRVQAEGAMRGADRPRQNDQCAVPPREVAHAQA